MGYERQHRDLTQSRESSDRELDQFTRQKIALISSHFPTCGRFVDMGCGSGQSSYDLARLFPRATIIGIDQNPLAIDFAQKHHSLENLSFQKGDISQGIFEPESLDGIFNSSVLHHVTSFHQFDTAHIKKLLDAQTSQLKTGGFLAIRDFVVPEFQGPVILELPTDDCGSPTDPDHLETWSTAELFLKFVQEFKSSLHPQGGVPWTDASDTLNASEKKRLFRVVVDFRTALEFILRKDYRGDWNTEILEEYTYFTKKQFEAELKSRGYKIQVSTSLFNPWIINNRFEGKIRLLHIHTKHQLPWPATNYLIVGQKVATHQPVELVEAHFDEVLIPNYLSLECHVLESTQEKVEICHRPQRIVDLIPWFRDDEGIKVLIRRGYPRPILNSMADIPSPIDDTETSGYVIEPISALWDTPQLDEVSEVLKQRINLPPSDILSIEPGLTYLPSSRGIDEIVESFYIEINPKALNALPVNPKPDFTEQGTIDALSAIQLLRSYQIGGLLDGRLNIAIYDLMLRKGITLDPWIGVECDLSKLKSCHALPKKVDKLFEEQGERFKKLPSYSHFENLRALKATFIEKDATNQVLKSVDFEYIVPRQASRFSCSVLPIAKQGTKLYLGLHKKNCPTSQRLKNSSVLYTVPAWRLGHDIFTPDDTLLEIRQRLLNDHGVKAHKPIRIGGSYAPSPGMTPERVTPFIAVVEEMFSSKAPLYWVELAEWMSQRARFHDGHLLLSGMRAAHLFKTSLDSGQP